MTLNQNTRQLRLSSSVGQELCLLGFEGKEVLSGLFRYRLNMISENLTIDPESMLGTQATIEIDRGEEQPRFFDGVINQFSIGDVDHLDGQQSRYYEAEIVPWLWLLSCSVDHRIFQHLDVIEIIEDVFERHGFKDYDTSQIRDTYLKREFCVQYGESAYQFVSRLAEEEGIFWYFRHENSKHTLVLSDGTHGYFDCPEFDVDYPRDRGSVALQDHITRWRQKRDFRSGRFTLADFNFKTPGNDLRSSESSIMDVPVMQDYEVYEFPGLYETRAAGRRFARIRMEEQEAGHEAIEGEGLCRTFTPGGMFRLDDHHAEAEAPRSYVIESIHHKAVEPLAYQTGESHEATDYENKFRCVPNDVILRPRRTTRRPIVEGPQTAVVVGPAGEEIYTDEHGRVKVQFHWDRVGEFNEESSCWIRVSQSHAGKHWGAIDLPRIGEEVIVEFLEGNPDRPIISGRVYNGENTPPFDLPEHKTRRGMLTTTHKGTGKNEFSMDDTSGAEQIRVNAQYNMDTKVGNVQTQEVGVDRQAKVGNNETNEVGTDRSTTIGNDESTEVGNNQVNKVGNHVVIDAGSSITLKCGASRIYMNSAGVISISGTIVSSAATIDNSVTAPLTHVTGGILLTCVGGVNLVKGGITHVSGGSLATLKAPKVDIVGGETLIKGAPIKLN